MLWLCAEVDLQVPPLKRRVHSLPIALLLPAVLSVRVRFEFPTSQFFVSLERLQYVTDGSLSDEKKGDADALEVVTAVWSGSMSLNTNELKLILFPGVYRLNVDVITGGVPESLQTCLAYSLAIYLQRQDHVEDNSAERALVIQKIADRFSPRDVFWFEKHTRLHSACQFALHTLPTSFVRGPDAHMRSYQHEPTLLMRVHGDGFPLPGAGESEWHWIRLPQFEDFDAYRRQHSNDKHDPSSDWTHDLLLNVDITSSIERHQFVL